MNRELAGLLAAGEMCRRYAQLRIYGIARFR